MAKPFLKWAGGKRQLLPILQQYLPPQLARGEIEHYFEPFVGGGAVLWAIACQFPQVQRTIFDLNPELIMAYTTIQRDVEALIEQLAILQTHYFTLTPPQQSQYYYQIRAQFNEQRQTFDFRCYDSPWIERTAMLIFLNRTCFNGLFRVNSQGDFNVPVGRYKNPKICDRPNLTQVSQILQGTQINQGDFTQIETRIKPKSFVYFDPPYRPLNRTASFNAYASQGFDEGDQIRLKELCDRLHHQGILFMVSNSDPHNIDPQDNFFDHLYGDYQIIRIPATRMINSRAQKRGPIHELLIFNYDPPSR
ncbi:DNA adenine methylase [Spirulina sp. CCNP1310]|uniref:DNA adenine methylase n=1 Tax=Spirulina sp. CCNP1310 TaxID=3110249 RepID=UPI002B22106A|nr:DNA adenine methylase [Spirulina sp. CCNP1310]MEA5418866.1 DNA adenine methylase [Spirulina sp. CCNP1310]